MKIDVINTDGLKSEERAALALKALYCSYGYDEYKLTGFEDYSLYAENRSFLDGKGVLSFGVNGKLLALRPDVTLSVVKNANASGGTNKLFYDERVYRKAAGNGEFAELRQIGVEVIGSIDGVTEAEVCELALKTLDKVSDEYILDVSHAGIIEKLLNGTGLCGGARECALKCLRSKNAHDFVGVAANADNVYTTAFAQLICLPAEPKAALKILRGFASAVGIERELAELERATSVDSEHTEIDFSIGGDADYYSGVVFKGFTRGVPYATLSGGRYDKLLNKFGKQAAAIGFALYLGELCDRFDDVPKKPDAIVIYDDSTADKALKAAAALRARGLNVLLSAERRVFGDGVKVYRAEDCV